MKRLLAIALIVLTLLSTPAQADHDNYPSFIDWGMLERWTYAYEYEWLEESAAVQWLQYWLDVERDGIYGSATHKAHRQAAMELSIPVVLYSTVSPNATFKPEVEQWRSIVEQAILANGGPLSDTARFLSIINCESGGDPDAFNRASLASGLMQHLANYWDARSQTALGYVASPFDGEANIRVSAWLIYRATGGGWQHWVCV